MLLLKKIVKELMLYEGLEISYSIPACLMNLNRLWNIDNTFFYEEENKTIKMVIQKQVDKKTFDAVITHINNVLGYFPSHITTPTENYKYTYELALELLNTDNFGIYFDAKYDVEISNDELPNYIYHISPSVYDDKIIKIGLAPKTKNKLSTYPARIYFGLTIEAVSGLLTNPPFLRGNSKFTIFKVNFEELNKVRDIRFFKDPIYMPNGIYTYENIPPEYITIIKKLDI